MWIIFSDFVNVLHQESIDEVAQNVKFDDKADISTLIRKITPEEAERKERLRFRLFVLLIVLNLFMIGYLTFEMVMIFAGR